MLILGRDHKIFCVRRSRLPLGEVKDGLAQAVRGKLTVTLTDFNAGYA